MLFWIDVQTALSPFWKQIQPVPGIKKRYADGTRCCPFYRALFCLGRLPVTRTGSCSGIRPIDFRWTVLDRLDPPGTVCFTWITHQQYESSWSIFDDLRFVTARRLGAFINDEAGSTAMLIRIRFDFGHDFHMRAFIILALQWMHPALSREESAQSLISAVLRSYNKNQTGIADVLVPEQRGPVWESVH